MTRARDLGDFIADGAAAELVVDTTTLVVDSTNNRVGIGTASPATALDVVGNATITTADNSVQLTLVSTDADANAGPILKLRRNSASPADNDLIGAIDWTSENSSGDEHDFLNLTARMRDVTAGSEDVAYAWTAYLNGTGREIQSFVNTDASAASMVFNEDSQDIDFRVESNGNANMLFVDGGNNAVGIGTSSPGMTLDVDGSSGPNDIVRFSGPNSGGLTFRNATSNEFILHTATSDALIFGTNGNNERMRIDSSGNLLLGTTAALGKFTVKIDTNKNIAYSGAIGEVGSVPAIYAVNDAGSSLESLGFRGTDIRFATQAAERFRFGSAGQLGIGGATYGTAGQVLSSGGASAAPTWADAGGGAYALLSTVNASDSSSVEFTSAMTGYTHYMVMISNAVPTTAAGSSRMYLRFNLSGGGVETGTSYAWVVLSGDTYNASAQVSDTGGFNYNHIDLQGYQQTQKYATNAYGFSSELRFWNMNSTSLHKNMSHVSNFPVDATGRPVTAIGTGTLFNTTAVDGLQFYFSGGNIESGKFSLYGMSV